MVLMSTLGVGAGGRVGGAWGAGMVGDGEAKAGLEETTGEIWYQYFSGE